MFVYRPPKIRGGYKPPKIITRPFPLRFTENYGGATVVKERWVRDARAVRVVSISFGPPPSKGDPTPR